MHAKPGEEQTSPRLVVDATRWAAHDPRVMYPAVKACFLGEGSVFPMVLVVTDGQYDDLPRTFDDLAPGLRIERVRDGAAGKARVAELAAGGALVAAPYAYLPYERWLATSLDRGITCLPADGLACFREHGTLPPLPAVTRPLAKVSLTGPDATRLPSENAFELRNIMRALAQGGPFELRYSRVSPETRLAWASQLGVEAAASPDEWAAGLATRVRPVPVHDDRDGTLLPYLRWIGRFTTLQPMVILTSSGVSLVRPTAELIEELRDLPDVRVEAIEADRHASLEQLFDAVAAMSPDDLLADPFLENVTAASALAGSDAEVLSTSARVRAAVAATASWSPHSRPAVASSRDAMRTLLARACPTAELRLRLVPGPGAWAAVGFVAPVTHVDRAVAQGAIAMVRPLAELDVRREDDLVAVRVTDRAAHDGPDAGCRGLSDTATELRIPDLGDDPSRWVERFLDGYRLESRQTSPRALLRLAPIWTKEPFAIPALRWAEADRELAFVLAALRRRLDSGDLLELPSGAVLLSLGHGIFAEIHAREHAASDERHASASLLQRVTLEAAGSRLLPLRHALDTHAGDRGPLVPHSLHLRGCGLRADVTFHGSALFLDDPAHEAAMRAGTSSGGATSK